MPRNITLMRKKIGPCVALYLHHPITPKDLRKTKPKQKQKKSGGRGGGVAMDDTNIAY